VIEVGIGIEARTAVGTGIATATVIATSAPVHATNDGAKEVETSAADVTISDATLPVAVANVATSSAANLVASDVPTSRGATSAVGDPMGPRAARVVRAPGSARASATNDARDRVTGVPTRQRRSQRPVWTQRAPVLPRQSSCRADRRRRLARNRAKLLLR
jgi:hypothetical protein